MTIQTEFLSNLFQGVEDGYLTFVRLREGDKGSAVSVRAPATDFSATLDEFVETHKKTLYFNIGVCRENLPSTVRGGKDSVSSVCCLWADIDMPKEGSKKKYPGAEAIASALADMPLQYTALIHTGGGVHVYWFLKEPTAFNSLADAVSFEERYSKPWMTLLKIKLAKYGEFDLDSVYDVSRMLRIPGSYHKSGPQCIVKESDYERRYNLDDFEPYLEVIDIGKLLPDYTPILSESHDGKVDQVRLDVLLSNSSSFKKIWDGKTEYTSLSEADMAIAGYGVSAGWTDDEIANLMIAWTMKLHPARIQEKYEKNKGYLGRTIAKARASRVSQIALETLASGEVLVQAEDAAKLAKAITDTGSASPSPEAISNAKPTRDEIDAHVRAKTLGELSRSLGLPIASWIQFGREDPIYTIVLATGQQIRIGGEADVVDSPNTFNRRIYSECQKKIATKTKLEWVTILEWFARIVEVVEAPESRLTEMARVGIRHYLESADVGLTKDRDAALRKQRPYHDGNLIHIYSAEVIRYINMHGGGMKWKTSEFLNAIRQIGFERESIAYEVDGKRTSTSYWCASNADYLDILNNARKRI